jgi:hypothetical protein
VPLHFGLGAAGKADEIEVRWPGGLRQTFLDVAARNSYVVRPGGELEVAAAPR